jgi:hypothetical protein
MSLNLSPEEILRSKESSSGFVYDDPSVIKKEVTVQENGAVEDLTSPQNNFQTPPPQPAVPQMDTPTSLGRVERKIYSTEIPQSRREEPKQPGEIGWKNLPMSILPSGGLFYPDGTRIAIRSADVKEIRHFSTIDEDDRLDLEEKLGYILDKCMRMDFPGPGVVSYQDLKSEDRFFVIMAIRDLTFTKGENSIFLIPDNPCENNECPIRDGFELRTGVLSMYKIDDRIMHHYDSERRCFSFYVPKLDKNVQMFVPSIGVSKIISDIVISLVKKGTDLDEAFIQISPFLFEDWKSLNESLFLSRLKESDSWTKEEFSLLFQLSEKIKIGTKSKANVSCPKCGGREVTANITFPEGFRSLFVISDILRELL